MNAVLSPASVLRTSVLALRSVAVPLVTALLLAELAIASLLAPLSAAAIEPLVRRSGRYAVANTDLAEFALTPTGLAVVVLAATAWVAGGALGCAAAMHAIHARNRGIGAGFGAGLVALRRSPSILALAARQTLGVLRFAAIPLGAIGLIAWFVLQGVDPNWLIQTRPPRFWIGLAIALPIALIGAALVAARVLSWSAALPICILERRLSSAALRESRERLRGKALLMAVLRGGWLLACAGLSVTLLSLARLAADLFLRQELRTLEMTALAAGVILVGIVLLSGVLSLLISAGNAAIVYAVWTHTAPAPLGGRERSSETAAPDAARFGRTRLALAGGLALLIIAGGGSARGLTELIDRPLDIELTAHRGAETVAPENTLAAINAAIDAGADRVEIDVMRSRDGVVVLSHDTDLRRIAGDARRVAELTLSELKLLDVGSWFDSRFAGERMPTLIEVLDATRGRTTLNIELKPTGDDALLATAVVEILHAAGTSQPLPGNRPPVVVTSLSPAALEAVRKADPSIPIGLVYSVALGDVQRLDVDLLSVESRLASPAFIARATDSGKAVHVWTVRDPDAFTRLALEGAAGVISPDVRPLRARLDELRAMDDLERLLLVFRARLLN